MPYVVTTFHYPVDQSEEAVKLAYEAMKKYPHDEGLSDALVQGVSRRTENGMKAMTIYSVKNGKLEEMLAIIEKRMALFRNLSGYNSQTEIWMTFQEGLEALDLKPSA